MRTPKLTGAYRADYKREKKGHLGKKLDAALTEILQLLLQDLPLPASNRDHALHGNWEGYRECHVFPDLLLIYDVRTEGALILVRLGSHSELFGR